MARYKMTVGKKIRSLRVLDNITQQELADKLNVSRVVVCNWEKDKSVPNKENIKKLAEVFNCDTKVITSLII